MGSKFLRQFSILAATCIVALGVSACGIFDSKLVSACELLLKDRLRAPSTYHRIEVSEYTKTLSGRDFLDDLGSRVSGTVSDRYRDMGNGTQYLAFIEYEASNGFGVPVRSTVRCDFFVEDGSTRQPDEWGTLINGKTKIESMLDGL